jgi:peptidoglycan hydrolase-like protein with peptidoglycan-binding domain
VAAQVKRIQEYLCAEKIDGEFGPETRALIKIWQETALLPKVTGQIGDNEGEGDLLVGDAFSRGSSKGKCDRNVYRNVYERENLGEPEQVKYLRETLAKLNKKHSLGMTLKQNPTSIGDLRGDVEIAGRNLGVATKMGITRNFQMQLTEKTQGL